MSTILCEVFICIVSFFFSFSFLQILEKLRATLYARQDIKQAYKVALGKIKRMDAGPRAGLDTEESLSLPWIFLKDVFLWLSGSNHGGSP